MKKKIVMIQLVLVMAAGIPAFAAEEKGGQRPEYKTPEYLSPNLSPNLSIDTFIRTAEEDYTLKNQKELNIYLENAPESTRYVDRVELRTKTEDFELEKQKYSMRVYPKGWGETKYAGMVNEAVRASGETDYRELYNKSLRSRYELVIEYLSNLEMIAVRKKQAVVCRDMITVLKRKSVSSVSFDIRDLISAEEFLTELKLELVKLENKKSEIRHSIQLAANSDARIAFDRKEIVSVKDIATLKKDISINNAESPGLIRLKNRVNLARNKYRLEQAKTRDYLSFLQVSYDSDEADEARKAYSVEVGIKLPFINSDRDDVNRKKLNYLEEKLNLESERRVFSEKTACLERSLDRMISQYQMLVNTNKSGSAQTSYKTYLNMEGVDPLTILKIKESILKNSIQRIEVGYEIRRRFIDFLYTAGKLTQKPFKNYLVTADGKK